METKALPSWTTGVEPLVERPCLPTPWRTTRRNTLLLIFLLFSLSLSFFLAPSHLPFLPFSSWLSFSRAGSQPVPTIPISTPDVPFSHSPRMFRLRQSITVGSLRFYRYRQGRPLRSRGRDLSALTIAGRIADRRIKWRGRIARISRSFRTDKRIACWKESRAGEDSARTVWGSFAVVLAIVYQKPASYVR